MKTYLFRRGYWHEQVVTERAAADAARRGGDLRGLGTALFSLAEACERLNRLDEAESGYREALEAFAAVGDLSGEADTCIGMAELVQLCRARHKSIYADLGTMPRLVQRDRNAPGGAGFWGWPGLRCSA
jgi:hypothetical protein